MRTAVQRFLQLLFMLSVMTSISVFAQTGTSSITGSVSDSSGGALPLLVQIVTREIALLVPFATHCCSGVTAFALKLVKMARLPLITTSSIWAADGPKCRSHGSSESAAW